VRIAINRKPEGLRSVIKQLEVHLEGGDGVLERLERLEQEYGIMFRIRYVSADGEELLHLKIKSEIRATVMRSWQLKRICAVVLRLVQ
jgi:hypothetical protein